MHEQLHCLSDTVILRFLVRLPTPNAVVVDKRPVPPPAERSPHTVFPHGLLLWPLSTRSGASPSLLSLSLSVTAACPPSAAFALRAPTPGHGAARLRPCAGRAVHRAASTASASRRERRTVHASQISQVKSSQVNSSVTEMKVGQPAQVCSFILTVRAERRSCDTHATSAERDWDPWNDGWRVLP